MARKGLLPGGHVHHRAAGHVQTDAASQGHYHQSGGAGEDVSLLQRMLHRSGGARRRGGRLLAYGGADGLVGGVQAGVQRVLKGLRESARQVR